MDVGLTSGLRIRRAGLADVDAGARLGWEAVCFDTHFGGVIERPSSTEAMRREVAERLVRPEPWTWLAERDGATARRRPVVRRAAGVRGMDRALRRTAPVACIGLMFVAAGERGSRIGAALVERMDRQADVAGVAVTLSHFARLNPLSAPFGSRCGNQSLWTTWKARPARSLR